ncbi:MAG: hypothetical protein ACRCSN_02655, partial [Dermatophilaceae bacterium]
MGHGRAVAGALNAPTTTAWTTSVSVLAASSLGGADPPGVGAAGLGLTTAGVVLQSSGATTASLRPHKDLWQGLS